MEKFKNNLFKLLNTFFEIANNVIHFIVKYPLLIATLTITIAVCFLILLIKKDVNVGGLLGVVWNFFNKTKNSPIAIANSIPSDRKQMIGEKDSEGFVQHKVSELPNSLNPFRDKTIVILPSGEKIKLPDGLKDTDVDIIIKTKAEVVVIPHDSNKVKVTNSQKVIEQSQKATTSAEELLKRLKAKQ